MKAGFGLVALLLTVAIILFLLAGPLGQGGSSYLQTVTNVKKEKEPVVQQWGGKDVRGRPLYDTIELVRWPESGKMRGAKVDTIDPTGPAATFYGLQAGDVIVRIQSQDVGGYVIGDEEAAEAFLTDAFRYSAPITIRRAGEEMTLPATEPAPSLPTTTPDRGSSGSNDAGGGVQLPSGLPGQ